MNKPSPLTKQQIRKVVTTAAYIAASGAAAALASWVSNNPDLFGVLFPVINFLAVLLKQVFTKQ